MFFSELNFNRFTALSFRNPEEFSNLDWNMRSRIAPLRNRRDVQTKRILNSNADVSENPPSDTTNSKNNNIILPTKQMSIEKPNQQNATEIDIQRTKRETPECVINYNSVRQLLVGCSQSNVIEVKPHCNDDGDEGNLMRKLIENEKILNKCFESCVLIVCCSTAYNCQGSWTENTTTFIVAMHSGSQHAVCISYQPIDSTTVRLYVGDSCYRSQPSPSSDHHLAANLTIIGMLFSRIMNNIQKFH